MNKEEAIKIVRSHYPANKQMLNEALEFLIPELKESEDERIKRVFRGWIYTQPDSFFDGISKEKMLKWLEKQNKNKPIERREFTSIPFGAFDSELIEQMFTIPDGYVATIEGNKIHIKRQYKTATEAIKEEKVDNVNKVESKFHEDDWVVRKDGILFNGRKFAKIIKINKSISQPMYLVDCGNWLYEDEIKLWTLSDAQDGDILVSSKNQPFIYNGWFDDGSVGAHCGLNVYSDFVISNKLCNWTDNKIIKPATKEERNSLFNKMNPLGWVWNPETKELNRLDKNNENNS